MNKFRQSGVALITAMLVVALASIAAAGMLSSAERAIHRTTTLQDTERAAWVADGVESWVMAILKKDRDANQIDSLDEDWSRSVAGLPVDYGSASGNVVDLQGRFNLNNLDPTVAGSKAAVYQQQFMRLIASLNAGGAPLPPGLPDLIRDWLDADGAPTAPFGAEDSYYLNLKLPYRTGNRLFSGVSELRAVQNITPKMFAALRPYVCALPKKTAVNLNTASEPVLRSLAVSVDEAKLAAFLRRRETTPETNVQKLKQDGTFSADFDPDLASVSSEYFQLRAGVFIGSSRVSLYSSIHRPRQGPLVVLTHSTDDN
ncbi:MAG: type II secretion system minor pseudopilin GspK [Pseudomonadota bacterium]